ncbi:MAG: OmpA family protein [Thermoanaerobaculia bacterium]
MNGHRRGGEIVFFSNVLAYTDPGDKSDLERFRNYEIALTKAGLEIVYQCGATEGECGDQLDNATMNFYPPRRYLNAKLARPQGDVWVRLWVDSGPWHRINIIEVKPMAVGMVKVDAAALTGDLERKGHVAVYGIYFDSGKADLKPESADALAEIAGVLEKSPDLKIHVVGHTDNVGALTGNMDLSRRRAEAVVRELTTKYKIAAARVRPDGVGPLSPIESNATEEGRSRNRRVELVRQ